jgi:hypothetical protein
MFIWNEADIMISIENRSAYTCISIVFHDSIIQDLDREQH